MSEKANSRADGSPPWWTDEQRGTLWSSEDTPKRLNTDFTDRESRCRVRKEGTQFVERSSVTDDSDVQDSQKLGSVRRDARSSTQE
eukprot:8533186-Pyramimonas_sp.AAC.1